MGIINAESRGPRKSAFMITEDFAGASSYTAGGDTYTSRVMHQIDKATVLGIAMSGYMPVVETGSVTGNSFDVQFFGNTGNNTVAGGDEIAAGTDLSSVAFTVLLEGN